MLFILILFIGINANKLPWERDSWDELRDEWDRIKSNVNPLHRQTKLRVHIIRLYR